MSQFSLLKTAWSGLQEIQLENQQISLWIKPGFVTEKGWAVSCHFEQRHLEFLVTKTAVKEILTLFVKLEFTNITKQAIVQVETGKPNEVIQGLTRENQKSVLVVLKVTEFTQIKPSTSVICCFTAFLLWCHSKKIPSKLMVRYFSSFQPAYYQNSAAQWWILLKPSYISHKMDKLYTSVIWKVLL